MCSNVGSIQTIINVKWDIYLHHGRHISSEHMLKMGNIYIIVLLVTLLIAVSSYEVYILK